MFPAMATIERGRRLMRAKARSRAAGGLRRTVVVGAVGLTLGSGVFAAGSALASNSVEPGNLIFTPANGSITEPTTWHTTDGCPVGYRASAEVSIFTSKGALLSHISPTVDEGLTGPFSGTLDGTLSQIYKFAQVRPGGQLLFMVGCYSLISGGGHVQWMQSAVITRPASSKSSYSASAGSVPARVTGPGVAGAGQSGTGQVDSVPLTVTNGSNALVKGLIAAACGLAVAIGGIVWYRRRQNRSRLV
jgi:hypothetical protein